MKNYFSWEHYEADRSRVSVWEAIGFGLVFAGTIMVAGLSIIIL